ncbi:serine/threonine protein kinase [Nitrospira sp. Kam-Ns4a]
MGGRFRAERLLKEGDGIETLLGTDLASGTPVVVKTASAAALPRETKLRLDHEATVLAGLASPWLAPLLSLGQEGDRLYLVTPYVPGVTLQARLAASPLSLQDTLTLGRCLFEALRDIHRHGVRHRDIKPANLIVNGDGPVVQATVIDFGLARSDRLDGSIRDLPAGTARYIAPEQAGLIKADLGPWSDLYSVGILLFECLVGRPPFQAEALGELLRHHLSTPPPRLRSLGLAVPRALDDILQRLLQKDPQDRYQSAEGVLADWSELTEALARGRPEPVVVIGARDRRRTLAEPVFIGRNQETEELETRWQEARRGTGRLVLRKLSRAAGRLGSSTS